MPITTCTKCGKCHDDPSEESANEPGRVCVECYKQQTKGKDMEKAIEKLAAACDELRRVSGQPYASSELRVYTTKYGDDARNCRAQYSVYSSTCGSIMADDLGTALDLAVRACGPEKLLERAKELREEAALLERKAAAGQEVAS